MIEPVGEELKPRYGHTMCISQNEQIIIFGGRDNIIRHDVTVLTMKALESRLRKVPLVL